MFPATVKTFLHPMRFLCGFLAVRGNIEAPLDISLDTFNRVTYSAEYSKLHWSIGPQ